MFAAMSKFPIIDLSQEKKITQQFVRIFGCSFLLSVIGSTLKSVYFSQILNYTISASAIFFASECFVGNIITEVVPISLMFFIHRKNLLDVAEVPAQQRESLISNSIYSASRSALTGPQTESTAEGTSSNEFSDIASTGLMSLRVINRLA